MKKYIPNFITSVKLTLSLVFLLVFIYGVNTAFVLSIIFLINMILNIMAKKYKPVFNYDKIIRKVSNSFIIFSALLLSTIKIDKALIIILILETAITSIKIITNIKNYYILRLNKLKFALLHILIIMGLSTEFNLHLDLLFYLLMVFTSLLQMIIIVGYLKHIKKEKKMP